jgi:hypothetical protein
MPATDRSRPRSRGWWALAALAFCLVATLNAGGYRFGVADQAFYLPAVHRHLAPESFPRDRLIIDDQDRLNVFTTAVAAGVRATGVPVEAWFAVTYVASLALLFGAAAALASWLGLSRWATAGALALLTLKHRIGMTGANSFEGYGHPRVLAFAIGLWAVVSVARSRTWWALALVAAAFIVHPTTALWFGIWVGATALAADRAARPVLAAGAAGAAALTAWVVMRGPLHAQAVVMDAEWLGIVGGKDYLFPDAWAASSWAMAVAYVAAVAGPFVWRRAKGRLAGNEAAVVTGLAALLFVFAATLPATAGRVALAVQFQVSRIFWMFDLAGTLYVAGLVVDGMRGNGAALPRRARAIALCLVVAAVARGAYVKWVEHPERPLARAGLPADEWQQALVWLSTTPADSLVIANPGHAWRYGVSVRVGASRDVLLEEVKDTAMSMYSRRVAVHVLERIRALGDFAALTDADVRSLASRYGASFLVDDRARDLPIAYRNPRFTVYRLGDH